MDESKEGRRISCFESEILHLNEEIETFQAEIDATIGQLRETLHAFRNLKKPDAPHRFEAERTCSKKLNSF